MMGKIGLAAIIIVGLGINLLARVVFLDQSPIGVTWDEAGVGYNSYSLLRTGRDEYGVAWPLTLRSLGDYKPALYSYFSILPVKLWGLNVFSVRIVSAVSGTLALISLGLWLGLFIKNKYLLWIIVALLGMGPARLHFSRMALETNLSSMFFGFGSYWWARSKKKLGLVAMVLAMWSYHSAKLAVPFFFVMMIGENFKAKSKELFKTSGKIILGLSLLVVVMYVSGKGGGGIFNRYQQENFLQKGYPFAPGEIFKNNLVGFVRLNPLYFLAGNLVGRATVYLSPANFSLNTYPWLVENIMSIPQTLWMGYWELLFLPIGLGVIIKNWKKREYRYLIYLYLSAMAAGATTWNWLNTLRGLSVLPVVEIASVLGLWWVVSRLRWKKLAILFWLVFAIWEAMYNANNVVAYANSMNTKVYFASGLAEVAKIVKRTEKDYNQVILDTNQEHAQQYWMFYMSYPPEDMQKLASQRIDTLAQGEKGFDFGKYKFRKINWDTDKKLKKTILWQEINSMTSREKIGADIEVVEVRGPSKDEMAGQLIFLK